MRVNGENTPQPITVCDHFAKNKDVYRLLLLLIFQALKFYYLTL